MNKKLRKIQLLGRIFRIKFKKCHRTRQILGVMPLFCHLDETKFHAYRPQAAAENEDSTVRSMSSGRLGKKLIPVSVSSWSMVTLYSRIMG